ncbi:hypothetical protein [Ruegeria lacuscaerulensis]|uniref:hypothetical protein n=1 Tax=Ruegeria lacuscaerulensis TaxID=55218 RepID=UPI00147A84F0|nr:hypothetical protein [Ruegeria lacuscaerulensis]
METVAFGDHVCAIERENQHGHRAVTKTVCRNPMSEMTPGPLDGALPVACKQLVHDPMLT